MGVAIKRVYEVPSETDGVRILVDRLWPRGVSKEHARIDRWLRDLSPSEELRRWFNHDPTKWDEFRRRYFRELDGHWSQVEWIRTEAARGTVTLLYAAREQALNNASALHECLTKLEN